MIQLSATELVRLLNPLLYHEGNVTTFTSISIDSRTLKSGDIFIAIEGLHFDGHNYIKQALKKGASCLIISKKSSLKPPQNTTSLLVSFFTVSES
ncbi:Mur ligase domain-containing protein [Chlamydiota bacterium]